MIEAHFVFNLKIVYILLKPNYYKSFQMPYQETPRPITTHITRAEPSPSESAYIKRIHFHSGSEWAKSNIFHSRRAATGNPTFVSSGPTNQPRPLRPDTTQNTYPKTHYYFWFIFICFIMCALRADVPLVN